MDSGIEDNNDEPQSMNCDNLKILKNEGKIFKCDFPECGATYVRRFRLQNHFNYVHLNMKCFKCNFDGCDKVYSSAGHLRRHQQTHKNVTDSYECKMCSVKIKTISNLKRHYNRVHNNEELCCRECNKKFRKKHRYEEHMKLVKHQIDLKSENNECPIEKFVKIFDNDKTTVNDKETENIDVESNLDNATKSIEFESDSESSKIDVEHKRKTKTYKCNFPQCNNAYNKPSRLKNHNDLHFNERPFKCTFEGCSKSFKNISHLKRHKESHQAVSKSYVCHICSVSISTLCNLKRHFNRVHNTEKELYCKQCNLEFRKKNRYEEHMAAHINSSIYICNVCGKKFLTHMKLAKHQLIHNSTKEYKCPVENCSEVFNKWAMMVDHKRTKHVIEYHCTKCDKVFLTKNCLKTHNEVHEEIRTVIPCPYEKCNRLYYFKRNLSAHIRIKHADNKFQCDICKIKLSTKQKIEYHIKCKHLRNQKPFKRKQQRIRKDFGILKKSAVSELIGIHLSAAAEKQLLNRNPVALLRDKCK